MNSAQRRKSKREHPFVITIECSFEERYFDLDNKIRLASKWCKKHCKDSWMLANTYNSGGFKFANHKDAMIFALKWL